LRRGGDAEDRLYARPGAAKLDANLALMKINLREIVLLHQFDQSANFSDIKNILSGRCRHVHGHPRIKTATDGRSF
jgi:hypothetical protein